MRRVFNEVWTDWADQGPITRPVLVSGHCPANKRGCRADAMAERLWRSAGLDIIEMPADWKAHGKKAGLRRNVEMVNATMSSTPSAPEQRHGRRSPGPTAVRGFADPLICEMVYES